MTNTPENTQKRLFLLDAYALIFRGYYALIKNPRVNSKGMDTSAIMGFMNSLFDVIKREKPDHLAVAFDKGGSSDRVEMYEDYKANRDETPDAIKIAVPYIQSILKAMHVPCIEIEGVEADDLIGTLSKQAEKEGYQVFMVTPDKDYAQLVSENIFMYKPARMGNGIEIWGIPEVQKKFEVERPEQVIDYLGMMGDASDNIPGLPGVGDKTAKKFIKQYGGLEGLLENTDKLKGKMKEKVIANAELGRLSRKLATIMLDCDVTFNAENYELSEPDAEAVAEIFDDLEFRRLKDQFVKIFSGEAEASVGAAVSNTETAKKIETASKKAAQAGAGQYNLFDANSTIADDVEEASSRQTIKTKEHHYQSVATSGMGLKLFLQNLNKQTSVCFDTETTGLNPLTAELVGIAFSWEAGKGFYLPFSDNKEEAQQLIEELRPFFENEDIQKVGQNLKYDIKVLYKYDIEVRGPLFDTMLAHYLINPDMRHNMDVLAETYLNYSPMELEGINLDKAFLNNLAEDLNNDIATLEASIYKEAGEEFNIGSPKQLGEILFDKLKLVEKPKKTRTGQYSTAEDVLSYLAADHTIVQNVLDYRGLAKLKSTYVDALPEQVEEDGRVHTDYMQTVAATGRLSSNNPNLQNIPIRTERGRQVRKAFVPKNEDYVLLAADYSQIELRIIAALSEEDTMIEAFKNGEDIHASTAAKVFNVPINEVTREQRSNAKTVNFGIIYGVSAFGLSNQTDLTRSESKDLIDTYYKTYPKLRNYMSNLVDDAREDGYVSTVLGRRRYLKDINSSNGVVRGAAERNAVNAPIQGSAADIIKVAMINIHKKLAEGNFKTKMLLQVHDELVFDVFKPELEKVKPIIENEMKNAMPNLQVPILVGMDTGKDWLEAH